jgi:hypothetical protein
MFFNIFEDGKRRDELFSDEKGGKHKIRLK